MKKTAAFAGLLLLASFAAAQTAPTFLKGSLDEALAQARTQNKLVLIDFFSSG